MNLTIDGRPVAAEPGTTILHAARRVGVDIPSLCQDDRLEPLAACRLCLVEVEGFKAPVAACATAAADGMVVTTETAELREQRALLLELLLSDHRDDCIVCDEAGACRLQAMAYRYGVAKSSYEGEARAYEAREDTPFIAYDPGKCILCGRCVSMCEEVQQCHVLDFAERGFESFVTTSFGRSMVETECELCGNCVSSCPTGALQDKLSRFACRTWDATLVDTVCPFCGCGCNLQLHVKDGRVVKVSSPVGKGPGEGNLCVKGRYGFQFIHHPDRLTQPLVRRDGELVPASWDEALELVARRFGEVREAHGADALAGFSSARCTNEENYLFQKFMRAVVGTQNVDHCARLCHASTVTGLRQSL
ncbi:MAG: formate dehydrogenase subunit alpha, partial [Actinomycetota bacterium]